MVANKALALVLVGTALLAGSARAQDVPASPGPVASGCAEESSKPPCLTLSTGRNLEWPAVTTSGDSPGGFRLFGNVKGVAVSQTDIARTTASFGSTWRLKTGIGYDVGGLQLTASTIVRRGYSLPITMVQPLGSNVQLPEPGNASLEFGAAATHWDTELRIRKTITSKGPVDVAVVGEALNLLNLNHDPAAAPPGSMLTSPTFRAGIVLGF